MSGAVVGSVNPLPRHSDEFNRLEHLLQVSCRSTAVKDVAAWSINNPHLTVMYERRSSGMLSVDCWLDITTLDARNPVQEVCKRGFYMPDSGEGLPFVTGNIHFDMDGPDTHQYLLCTIAVGRSFVQDDPAAQRTLPGGYDSVYLHIPDAGDASGAAAGGSGAGDLSSGDGYRHTYVVFDSAQVIPRYVVHFGYHPRERLLRAPQPPINLAEIKARVADALSLLGPAAPAATEKMLSDIGDAYEAAISSSQSGDPLLEERRKGIRDLLKHIDGKLAAVQANSAAVEEALYAKLQEALFALQEETQRKMNLLLSEELELRRQLQQIEWTESFVDIMQGSLPPMSFVAAWERHASLRSQLYSSLSGGLSAKVLEEVQPDMKLVGSISVTTERAAAAGAFAAAASAAGGAAAGAPLLALPSMAGGGPAAELDARLGAALLGGLPSASQLGASLAASGGDAASINALVTSLLRESIGIRGAAAPAHAPAPAPAAAAPPPPPPPAAPASTAADAAAAAAAAGYTSHPSSPSGTMRQTHTAGLGHAHDSTHSHASAAGAGAGAGAGAPVLPRHRASLAGAAAHAHAALATAGSHTNGTTVATPMGSTAATVSPAAMSAATAAAANAAGFGALLGAAGATQVASASAEDARLTLATAKAQLSSIERSLETLPASARAGGEAARAAAQARVADAEALYGHRVREEASAFLTARVGETTIAAPPVRGAGAPGAAAADAHLLHAASTSAAAAARTAAASGSVPAAPPAPALPASPPKALDVEERRARHSIRAEADRKRRVYAMEEPEASFAFPASRILAQADANALYLCLPFGHVGDEGRPDDASFGAMPPAAKLIWATYDGSSTVQSFMNAYAQLGNGNATVVLIKATNGHVFGGYAATPWAFDDLFGGSPRSFLFSVTRDVKVPYTGRTKGPKQITDDLLRQEHEAAHEAEVAAYEEIEAEMAALSPSGVPEYDAQGRLIVIEVDEAGVEVERVLARPKPRPFVRCDATKSSARSLQFGVRDLVLSDDFTRCSSEIEGSYGIGLRPGSAEARSLLAGAPEFVPETIEIWSISSELGATAFTASVGDAASLAGRRDSAGYSQAGASAVGGGRGGPAGAAAGGRGGAGGAGAPGGRGGGGPGGRVVGGGAGRGGPPAHGYASDPYGRGDDLDGYANEYVEER